MARRGGAAAAPARARSRRDGQRLLRRLDLPGRRVPARVQPLLDAPDVGSPARVEDLGCLPPPAAAGGAASGAEMVAALPRLARALDRRRVLAVALDRPPLRARAGTGAERRRLVRHLPRRDARELRADARGGRVGGGARRAAPARGAVGAREHLRRLPGPRLRRLRAARRSRRGRDPARVARASPPRRSRRRLAARADLRDGREPMARRGRVAARTRPRRAVVPPRRRRPLPRAAVGGGARRVRLRPERPGADRRRADVAPGADDADELRPARRAEGRGACGRPRLHLGAARGARRGDRPARPTALRGDDCARHRLRREAQRRAARRRVADPGRGRPPRALPRRVRAAARRSSRGRCSS